MIRWEEARSNEDLEKGEEFPIVRLDPQFITTRKTEDMPPIKIDDGVILAPKRSGVSSGVRNEIRMAIQALKPTQSFFVSVNDFQEIGPTGQHKLRGAITQIYIVEKKHHPEKIFVTRKATEGGLEGIRCWRLQ